jgi:hypothetical protein
MGNFLTVGMGCVFFTTSQERIPILVTWQDSGQAWHCNVGAYLAETGSWPA